MSLKLVAGYRRRVIVAAVAMLFAVGGWEGGSGRASGQVNLPNQLAPDGAPNGGVFVHDSAIALDRMALAVRLEGQKDWSKSAEIYQEIIEKYRDRVVPSATDDQGVINQYVSVLKRVDEHLRAWPPEGLTVYNSRYELAARNLLQTAAPGDLGPLHEVFTRYYITDSGKQAGLKLIDAYFELGDFPAATWIAQELLLHPGLLNDRAKVLFRIGLASHMSGDEAIAQKSLAELKDKFAAATGTVGGRDVKLADELAADLTSLHPSDSTTSESGDSSPMFGGNPSRDRTYSSTARPGAKLYSINLSQPDWRATANPEAKDFQANEDDWRKKNGSSIGVIPVADRGELYFQDNAHLYAVSLETGGPLPAWHATYPDHGQFVLGADGGGALVGVRPWNLPFGNQFTVTLTDSAVLAVMGISDPFVRSHPGDQGGTLVCLDRTTGKLNWTISARSLADQNIKALDFESSPLAVGDNVFLAARGSPKGDGYADCYVLCFNLNTGALRWSCYVATGAAMEQSLMDDRNRILPAVDYYAHLAYAGGRVFVSTNLGAVGALDAYSGDIAWVNIYRDPGEGVNQGLIQLGRFGGGRGRGGGFFGGGNVGIAIAQKDYVPPTPWTENPPIVHDGNVFILPDDGKYLLVYDAGDGHLVKKLNKSDCCQTKTESQQPQTLVGLLDGAIVNDNGQRMPEDLLFVATKSYVVAIKWREYDPATPDQSIAWATSHGGADQILGRPFLTNQSVYIPSTNSLYRVDIRNGKVVEYYPASSTWPSDEGPGNVLVCGEHVVIAGDQRVSVYTDLAVAKARLDQDVAAAAADPNARLHYAEVMFLANEPILATQKLDEAIKLLGSDNDARRRAFNDAMDFAVKNWLNKGTDPQSAFLFDRAATLARDAEEQVKYRMARARFAHRVQHDPGAAIKLCQEIFADNALATAMVGADFDSPAPVAAVARDDGGQAAALSVNIPPAVTGRVQAGPAAEKMIATLLLEPNGPPAYAPFELAAASEVAAASAAQSAERLAAVAVGYPNSSVAAQARQKAADLYEAKGDYQHAVQMLRAIYSRVDDDGQRLVILEAMARNYLHIPGRLESAASRLIGANRIDNGATLVTAMRLPDGRVLSHLKISDALKAIDPQIDAAAASADEFPEVSLPGRAAKQAYMVKYGQSLAATVPDATAGAIPNVGVLLAPEQKFARNDRLATWTSGQGISIYPVGKTQSLGTDADFTDQPAGAAWVSGRADLLAWGSSTVMLVTGDKAATQWKINLATLGHLEVVAQAAPQVQSSMVQPINPNRLRGATRQRPMAPNAPIFALNAMPGGPAAAGDDADADSTGAPVIEHVDSATPAGNVAVVSTSTGRVVGVDIGSGRVLWQFRLTGRAMDRVLVSEDFTVLKAADSSAVHLAVLDTRSGRLLARCDFAPDDTACPVNMALGEDGSFAYSTPDEVYIFDLFEADRDGGLKQAVGESPSDGNSHFAGMSKPDQMIINDGMVLCLSDRGQILRGYSLRTGQPRDVGSYHSFTNMVEHGAEDFTLRSGGRYLYAWGPGALEGINLNSPSVTWPSPGWKGLAQQILVGKDFLLVLNQPFGQVDSKKWTISAFSRAIIPPANNESGLLVHQIDVNDDSGIFTWQLVDGGICYLSGDHTLHLLRGNNNPAPPPPPPAKVAAPKEIAP